VIVSGSIILRAEGNETEKMGEFTSAIKTLMANALLIDENFQIEPRNPITGREPYYHADDIPHNFSKMSFHIKTSGGADAFKMKKPRKSDKKGARRNRSRDESDEEEELLIDPQVYFDFAFSTDVTPLDLIQSIDCEWGKMGGQRFYLKAFNTFDTDTAVMAIKVLNNAEPSTITAEFLRMFQEAKDTINAGEASLGNSPWVDHNRPLPQLGVRVQMPKISGQDTSVFSGWNNKQQFRHKMIHFEFVSDDIPHVHKVVTVMKQTGILRKYWGKNAHLSNIVKNDI
jgi:hypothetical protein